MKKIGVFDSGIGGFTVLEEIKKVLPNESYIYYADSKHNPYGEKSDDELYGIVCNVVEFLILHEVKLIVIACNTATTRCMKRLKEDYKDILFVGIVPAVKVACDHAFKHTLIMATPGTVSSKRMEELILDNKREDQEIMAISCDGLAHLIEIKDDVGIDQKLEEIFRDFRDDDFDSIVLGCTHYPLIKDKISRYFPRAILLDGSLGVAKEVKRQLETHGLLNEKMTSSEVEIFNSNVC